MGADAVGCPVRSNRCKFSKDENLCTFLISNQAAGKSTNELSEVSETANQILPKMKVLTNQILNSL